MTHSALLQRMSYDSATGIFTANQRSGRRNKGDQLGYVKADGYRMIFFLGKWRYAHRLAWFYVHGEWPANEIDHINGERDDNRFENLRSATRSQNMMNTARGNGVCWHKRAKCWQVTVKAGGVRHYIGRFKSRDEAEAAASSAALRLHGDFASIAPPAPKPVQEDMGL